MVCDSLTDLSTFCLDLEMFCHSPGIEQISCDKNTLRG